MMKHIKKALSMLLVLCMVLSFVPVGASALTMGTKPADGTTTGNPFVKGTGGSNSFRIPALVTLNDGTLVAAADARWDTTYDGGGLDTIVSYSTNNGANWNYTFANYLGDNGNTYNGSSTCFIDPALATDGETVYMLCDLYPYGVALNGNKETTPSTAVGFNSDGKLLLSTDGTNYNYYLDGTVIKDSSGNEVSGLTVDAYFNVTGTYNNTTYNTNLFFSDSPFKVVRTGYLYLTKSTDGGKSWSEPTLISNVKTSSEQVCLVGPGRGLVTDGKIIFPVYSYNGSSDSQRMGFIYSTNSGATWTRVDSSISWSSESAVVALTDGTLRFFYRNGTSALCYADYTWETGWGSAVNTGIATNSNTQISAISYSKTVDGKQVILVSCPTGPNEAGSDSSSASNRLNGKIFVGLVNDDGSMSWQDNAKISVPSVNSSNQFMYSCLTELSNGKVAILYEDYESAWGNGYYTMSYATYDLGLTTDSSDGDNEDSEANITATKDITLTVGETKTETDENGNYTNSYTGKGLDTSKATVTVSGSDTTTDGSYAKATSITSGNQYLITIDGNHVVTNTASTNGRSDYGYWSGASGLYIESVSAFAYGNNLEQYLWTITKSDSGYTVQNANGKYLTIGSGNSNVTLSDTSQVLTITNNGDTFDFSNGNYYLNNFGGADYDLFASSWESGASGWTLYEYTPGATAGTTTISFKGVSAGETSVIVGTTKYNITVNRKNETVNVSVGGTATYTDASTGTPVVKDSTVATATLSDGTLTIKGVAEGTTTVTTDTTVYTVNVTTATLLTIPQGSSETISVTLGDGQYVKWHTANSSYVGVAGVYDTTNLVYTNAATVFGQQVTSSAIEVTGTIYNSDGTVVSASKWLVTVTEAAEGTTSVTRYYDVDQVENCVMYYSINGGELVQVNGSGVSIIPETGVDNSYTVIDGTWYGDMSLMFFVAPNDGYAVTHLFVEDSANQYYVLSDGVDDDGNEDVTKSSAWPFNDGINPEAVYTDDNGHTYSIEEIASLYKLGETSIYGQVHTDNSIWKVNNNSRHGFRWALLEGYVTPARLQELYEAARALGCTGVTTVTKGSGNNTNTGTAADPISICAIAQKLATLDKEVTKITNANNEDVTEAGIVKIGYTISYKVTVTVPATPAVVKYWDGTSIVYGNATETTYDDASTISYTNMLVRDSLSAYASGFNWTHDAATSSTTEGSDSIYSVEYTITLTKDNFGSVVTGGSITNTATLDYNYTATYGTGSYESSVDKVLDVTVDIPNYVVDFGLPVEISLSNKTDGTGEIVSCKNGQYGTAELNSNKNGFIYKPTEILQDVDYVEFTYKLTNDNTNYTYRVAIYPATTVYYEEGFASYSAGWTDTGSKGTGTQATQIAGSSTDKYGYDAAYNAVQPSNNSQATSNTKNDKAEFTFTGTGVDIYTNSTYDSGKLTIQVKNSAGSTVKLIQVDTSLKNGTTTATEGQEVTGYNVPVASISGLTHGSYTVSIIHTDENTVNLDGFRVYGTLATEPDFYKDDLEDNPTFIELRDQQLKAMGIESTGSNQTNASTELPDGSNVTVAVVANNKDYTTETANDLLTNGPKNEIYLQPGQALVLKIKTDREVQIGLKALDASTTYKITGKDEQTLSTSTDMFYTVLDKSATAGRDEQVITITNSENSDGILSITKLKVCDDPNATLCELTEDDLTQALVDLGLIEAEEPVTPDPEDPEESEQPGEPDPEPEEPEQPSEPDPEPEKPQKPQNPNKPQKPQHSKPGKPISSGGNKGNGGGRFKR